MIRSLATSVALSVCLFACGKPDKPLSPVVDAGTNVLPRVTCLDNDGDGFAGTGDCQGEAHVDCNDNEPSAYPGALELCNGLDDTCDGQIDEGLPIVGYYRDEDGDGVGAMKTGEGCKAPPTGSVTQQGDCNDQNPAIRPGAAEICNATDDDCDGTNDNGIPFQDFYADTDGDGFGAAGSTAVNSCQTSVMGRVTNPSDCNDADPTVKPGATELCNRVDDNCDGQLDNGIAYASYYPDMDGDGFGDASASAESACNPVAGKVLTNNDCNDAVASIKPMAPETCNGVDDDCDMQVDEGLAFATYYADMDGDGFGAAGSTGQSACMPVAGRVTNATDCNDASPMVKPGATEVCNGVDDDCTGGADNGLTFSQYFTDMDGDGFGASNATAQSACAPVSGKVTNNTDCNDSNPAVKPGAPETCNSVDDDCDSQTDEGLTFVNYYPDGDGDSYGSSSAAAQNSCTPIAGRVTNNTDCNDANASVNPGRTEVCNALDDNCAGGVDEGLATTNYYRDNDGDGYGSSTATAVPSCGPVAGHVTNRLDCNDTSSSVRPGAPEMCNNADDNCDGDVDNGVATQNYYVDNDGDGFGASGSTPQASCSAVLNRVTNATDCNDSNFNVKPGATEVCNGVDDNCAGGADEGLSVLNYYPDLDGDGYGAAGSTAQASCVAISGKVTNNTDCNDSNLNVRPGRSEVCNGVDDNCANGVDEGLATQNYYTDGDGDGFGAGSALASCGPVSGRVTNNTDCNDGNSAIKPTAVELCNNVDDNCTAGTDEGNPGGGGACSTGQSGVCGPGTLTCQSGTVACVRNTAPSPETCNTLDDDCDGTPDDGFSGLGATCTAGQGVCLRSGTNRCNAAGTGVECSVDAGLPTASACDGADNDCDGITDEPVLSSTADVSTSTFTDIEVKPFYFTAGGCQGGVGTAGSTDALVGGAMLMTGGASGLVMQRLDTNGAPAGGLTTVSGLSYTDADFAQAGDGYIVAGVWASNNAEIDLYYADRNGAQLALKYTQFKGPTSPYPILDSVRVVRGNGRRATIVWREAGAGIKLAQVEACLSGSTWSLQAPGCASTMLTPVTLVASTTALTGVGADSNVIDWTSTQTCQATTAQRRLGVSYQPNALDVKYFNVDENGANKAAETLVYRETAPASLADSEIFFMKDATNADRFVLAAVTNDTTAPAQSDLNFWISGDTVWRFAYWGYARENGAASILRPRGSATATGFMLTALRYVADASTFKRQVMTRTFDLTGARTPEGAEVELSPTTGGCSGAASCRPGDKGGLTNWYPFRRLYYSGSGSTPAGSYTSGLTCN